MVFAAKSDVQSGAFLLAFLGIVLYNDGR